jgi:aminoglycoside phosphotransferase (APT) family kinase protein
VTASANSPATTVAMRQAHRFDEAVLAGYLAGRLPGVETGLSVRQFQGGQSNPTFLLTTGDGRRYVLRKKPPGTLLPKAHQIEREHRIMAALVTTSVPVPAMRLICETDDVIGTAFFVMDHVDGRLLQEPLLELPKGERAPLFFDAIETLAHLHSVDWRAAGLADFGRPDTYAARQVARWSQQYEASRAGTGVEIPAIDWLKAWLAERDSVADETAIVHGDFRLGNMIVDTEGPHVAAVIDWELSTLGHPLADLAYFCMPYHLPANVNGVRGMDGLDLGELGIPAEADLVISYCEASRRSGVSDWPYFLAFSLFRMAAILHGVAARGVQGNASNSDAREVGSRAMHYAEAGKRVAKAAQ